VRTRRRWSSAASSFARRRERDRTSRA